MAAVSIRNLDDDVKRRLCIRAAQHGRSMEAEIRAILTEVVNEPEEPKNLLMAIHDRFSAIGGVELELPERTAPRPAPDFSS